MSSTLRGAVETAPVASVHAFTSKDPDAFEVPGGREEEWRFTPLRRLRALHKDAPLGAGGLTVEVDAPPEIRATITERAALDLPASAFSPADRVSARAYAGR